MFAVLLLVAVTLTGNGTISDSTGTINCGRPADKACASVPMPA